MVSYADMVTLLFACFAALYASSVMPATAAADTTPPPESRAEANAALADAITSAVGRVDPSGEVVVTVDARGVVVSLPEAGAFAVGQADLSQAARQVIRELAQVLEQETGDIRIEGHSDDVPITTSRYASNWDLSAARATEVIRFLLAQTAIAPQRLSAAGYGEFRPLVANDSPESRARNRRVDIVITRN
jgi:chemotaxis protein MotB